jgi:hypothetical protein
MGLRPLARKCNLFCRSTFIKILKTSFLSSVHADELKRVRFLTPGEALISMEELSANDADSEETVLGYNVKTKHKTVA